jgi:hypothetical protein
MLYLVLKGKEKLEEVHFEKTGLVPLDVLKLTIFQVRSIFYYVSFISLGSFILNCTLLLKQFSDSQAIQIWDTIIIVLSAIELILMTTCILVRVTKCVATKHSIAIKYLKTSLLALFLSCFTFNTIVMTLFILHTTPDLIINENGRFFGYLLFALGVGFRISTFVVVFVYYLVIRSELNTNKEDPFVINNNNPI